MEKENYDFVLNYLRQLLQEHKELITQKQLTIGYSVIEIFEEWNKHRNITWDKLYCEPALGEFEEDRDKDSIYFYAYEMEYKDNNIAIQEMWRLIRNVLTLFIRIAIKEEKSYSPEDIECINPNKADNFFILIQKSSMTPKELTDYFNKKVCCF